MKFIAHRGNTEGPDESKENRMDYIEDVLVRTKYDVEVDLWFSKGGSRFATGHTGPHYPIRYGWLNRYVNRIWLHVREIELYCILCEKFNCFMHVSDAFGVTSKGYIWTPPSGYIMNKKVTVDPKGTLVTDVVKATSYAICSDYSDKVLCD